MGKEEKKEAGPLKLRVCDVLPANHTAAKRPPQPPSHTSPLTLFPLFSPHLSSRPVKSQALHCYPYTVQILLSLFVSVVVLQAQPPIRQSVHLKLPLRSFQEPPTRRRSDLTVRQQPPLAERHRYTRQLTTLSLHTHTHTRTSLSSYCGTLYISCACPTRPRPKRTSGIPACDPSKSPAEE